MKIILDTCTFLYAALESKKLSDLATTLIENSDNTLFLSSISVYEILVKYKLGKLELTVDPIESIPKYREILNVSELPIREVDVLHLPKLPVIHNDPFDRIIITQALANGFLVLTLDKSIHDYQIIKAVW